MSPGGHAITTVIAGATAAGIHSSLGLTLGIAAGGFFIDVDHALDYVLVNRQTNLRPSAFLRYYLEGRPRHVVLALHSYELFALLVALAWWLQSNLLWGYILGGLMHLVLDILFNGELLPDNVLAFYCFAYRAAHRFRAVALHGMRVRATAPVGFWRAFFAGAHAEVQDTRVRPRP
jgi:hypothetical protein